MSASERDIKKKLYQTPEVRVYGDVQEITQANATSGASDHVQGPFKTA
jgi:hypothetical protein